MDVSKLRAKDLLNPKKWVDFAAGTYYEATIGFHRCEQLIYYLGHRNLPNIDTICSLSRDLWNTYKVEEGLVGVIERKTPLPYTALVNEINGSPLAEYFEDVPLYFAEQAVERSIICAPCLVAKSCSHCGCSTPANFMAPTNVCSGGKWRGFSEEEVHIVLRDSYKTHLSIKSILK